MIRLNLTKNKNSNRTIVNFQVFTDSVHQAELERYQGHFKLDERYPYAGYLLSGNRSNFLDYEGNILWFYNCTEKVSPLYVLKINVVTNESRYSIEKKNSFCRYTFTKNIFL